MPQIAQLNRPAVSRWTLWSLALVAVYALVSVMSPAAIAFDHPAIPPLPPKKKAKDERPADPNVDKAVAKAKGEPKEQAKEEKAATVVVIQVPLPLTGNVDQLVQGQISRAVKRLPADAKRPTLILEFRPEAESAGEGSDFSRAHSLARYLVGEDLATVKTVAYLPHSVKGHAVLPVLACEQIVMSKDAELGAAGVDEKLLDETMRGAYREFATRRLTIPPAVALGMLDDDLEITRVTTPDGVRYETAEGVAKLRADGLANREDTLFRGGEKHFLDGNRMRQYGFATHLAEDKPSLAAALNVSPASLRAPLVPDQGWKPIRVEIDGPVNQQKVNWIRRVVNDHRKQGDFNLLCIEINSAGGNVNESVRLAQAIADFGKDIRTVGIIRREARADAGIIAWACDDLVMWENARIGGQGDARNIRDRDRENLRGPLEQIAMLRQRTWSLPLALVDSNTQLWPYQRAGSNDFLYLSTDEWSNLPEKEDWLRGANMLPTADGFDAKTAHEIGLATHVINSEEELKSLYHLDGEIKRVRSNWALQAIEWLADPRLSAMLLFVAMFALMIEFSSPGVGVPGFVALLCFVLFFWSQFLHGTATGLEICLFVVGIICVLIEIFVAPGTMVFGLGGGLMIVSSIILASQTFVLPTNTYQLQQMPVSLTVFIVGLTGAFVAVGLVRRYLPETPYFNKMILQPPGGEELEHRQVREQLVQWAHLSGKRGVTTTALFPSGKALFGDEMVGVVSAGEMIEKGASVVVVEVLGSRVLVREV
ncbi:NfeD family protein [Anatilimnocola floriformis]|uniref:NfeD family protein n=1 Tax=Anatilimnocola floriformis TaxID=2948575 RepID=UPI0020C1D370|nr:NfeD family protein [Anatilimnocola floriformis]